nr:UNC93-like protein MFSD11 [Aotus nancymaae]
MGALPKCYNLSASKAVVKGSILLVANLGSRKLQSKHKPPSPVMAADAGITDVIGLEKGQPGAGKGDPEFCLGCVSSSNITHTKLIFIFFSKEVAILCSFLLGLGDSCFNTQLLSILGFLYSEDSAPAFAIFKFVQSICAAVAFFYSNYLLLHWQLLVMVIFGFFGTISFFTVEWEAAAFVARGSDYRSI